MTDVLQRYEVEFTLTSSNNVERIAAVRVAYFDLALDMDQIATISGLPVWRIRDVVFPEGRRQGKQA